MGTDNDPDGDWRAFFPPSLRTFPADLVAVVVFVALAGCAALLPVVRETLARPLFALLFSVFVPGYAFVAALFPERGESADGSDAADPGDASGIDGMERVALSFGTSIAIVPLVGLVLNFTPWGLRLGPILVSLSGLTLLFAYVGAQRRAALDPDDRFRVPYERWVADARAELFDPETRTDAALNVVMVASLLLAVGSVGFVAAFPKQGEAFSEFYLLTERDDGTLVADDYPTEFVAGNPQQVVVGVGNHEHERVSYTVVSELQRVRVENNSTTVLDAEPLGRFSSTVDANETWHRRHRVAPTMTGDDLRLTYLLYRGEPPATPTTDNAYRSLRLWVNVTAPAESATTEAVTPAAGAVGAG
ncbi:DUF1616 domain-containing protein [Candidatus Halobonum tyrrellensis]|uniref:DUF1616 domain-containing protein n=1 Tax=Candidatus Halobonum tyrrellensis G22 TaxID=1324957 RepID=V4HH15_9EURY|nr:DUF1616 domain-containing protein [Candidatus Halobonum tyrrellensis]ESP90020.1 hypothetical protein K933_00617 [Candidatus Halobonum tyrrellensis G22]